MRRSLIVIFFAAVCADSLSVRPRASSAFSNPYKKWHFHPSPKSSTLSSATKKEVAGILNGILGRLSKHSSASLEQVVEEVVSERLNVTDATAVEEGLRASYEEWSSGNGTALAPVNG